MTNICCLATQAIIPQTPALDIKSVFLGFFILHWSTLMFKDQNDLLLLFIVCFGINVIND